MFRILLHPHDLPRHGPGGGARALLTGGWNWWRARITPSTDLFYSVRYDHPSDILEASLLVAGADGELIDPPAFHLSVFPPEYEDFAGATLMRAMMVRGWTGHLDVVALGSPASGWDPLPGTTCRPGDYQIEESDRQERRYDNHDRLWDDSTRRVFTQSMEVLRWPAYPPQTRRVGPARYTAQPHWSPPTRYAAVTPRDVEVTRPRFNRNVLPESEVVDAIDRLVNEQVQPGPCDDYSVNRYPKCARCGHDWHGLECVSCDCLNTDWLKNTT